MTNNDNNANTRLRHKFTATIRPGQCFIQDGERVISIPEFASVMSRIKRLNENAQRIIHLAPEKAYPQNEYSDDAQKYVARATKDKRNSFYSFVLNANKLRNLTISEFYISGKIIRTNNLVPALLYYFAKEHGQDIDDFKNQTC